LCELLACLYHKPLKHQHRRENNKYWQELHTAFNPAVIFCMQELVTGSSDERALMQVAVAASSEVLQCI